MTWATARARLVTMIEGITATTRLGAELGAQFTHAPDWVPGREVGQSRAFAIELVDTRTIPPPSSAARWREATVAITVPYLNHNDRAAVDEAIGADFEAISDRLLDESTWSRPSSTIIDVANRDGEPTMIIENIDDDDGAPSMRLLRITTTVVHTSQTS